MKKLIFGIIFSVTALTLITGVVVAAAPDGSGPWADSVVGSNQGLRKDGSAVIADRSNPNAALGIAETTGTPSDSNTTSTNFFSLGFGGVLTVGFDNAIVNGSGNDLMVYEVTGGTYPDEKIKVEASHNGTDWITLSESSTRDASLDLGILPCAKFVRVTDVSEKNSFSSDADGYDVDAIKALNSGTVCNPESSISIEKSSNFSEINQGEEVTYTYTIKNTGDFNLSNVVVTDDKCGSPVKSSGDNNNVGVLDLTETWIYTCTQALDFTTTNTATVGAKDPFEDEVNDEDELTVAVKVSGCTLTQGYWKNHALGSKHQDLTWSDLVDPNSGTPENEWLTWFETPVKGNAWYQLAHQYAAALLNKYNGAYVPADVMTAMTHAVDLLNGTGSNIYPFTVSKSEKQDFVNTAGILAGFNEGNTVTPHCSEMGNLTGEWLLSVNSGAYLHDLAVVTQNPDGSITGHGGYPAGGSYLPGYDWTMTGQISGNNVTMTITYSNSYVAIINGTIDPSWNSMSGGAGTGGVTDWLATRIP